MNNTTVLLLSQNNTEVKLTDNYDSIGAIIFTIVVLLWYSLSFVLLLGMQMITPAENIEDPMRYSEKLFTQNFQEKHNNKRILGKKIKSID